jgi:hypothetical protein
MILLLLHIEWLNGKLKRQQKQFLKKTNNIPMKQFILIFTLLLIGFASFGQSDSTEAKTELGQPCKAVRKDFAVQIASTVDPNVFIMQPSYKEVLDNFETEKVCLKDGTVRWRILIPAEDWVEATLIESYYKTTRNYKDCFIVTYIDGKRLN